MTAKRKSRAKQLPRSCAAHWPSTKPPTDASDHYLAALNAAHAAIQAAHVAVGRGNHYITTAVNNATRDVGAAVSAANQAYANAARLMNPAINCGVDAKSAAEMLNMRAAQLEVLYSLAAQLGVRT